MNKKLFGAVLCTLISGCVVNQTPQHFSLSDAERIELAERFITDNLNDKVTNTRITPHWLENGTDDFWYQYSDDDNNQAFMLYDATKEQLLPLFDKKTLTASLSVLWQEQQHIDWSTRPLEEVTYQHQRLSFEYKDKHHFCTLEQTSYQCQWQVPDDTQSNDYPNLSVENYNIKLCREKGCKLLTTDGTSQLPYAIYQPWPESYFNDTDFDEQSQAQFIWSDDRRFAVSYRLNRQHTTRLTLTDSTDDDYSVKSVDYYYPQAGDENVPVAHVVLIDIENEKVISPNAPDDIQTYYGAAVWGEWVGQSFYFVTHSRNNKKTVLNRLNAQTGKLSEVIVETDDKFIDPWALEFRLLPERNQIVWSSQRDGYNHYYLFDAISGEEIRQLTSGNYTVREIEGIDQENGVLYFTASGKEPDRDPYLKHFYRVSLDGSEPTLLTPEAKEHSIALSPSRKLFVNTFSDIRSAPQTWLRRTNDGEFITKLAEANVSKLLAMDWQPPEPFSVLAEDGKTRLYGVIYKPTHFDTGKRYPVIDNIYTGPHGFFTPKSYLSYANTRQSIAELGYVVIRMDGRGTSSRGRDFQEVSYKNLAGGSDDHVWAIKELAKNRPWMDISSVGIYGFSAGGYDTVQAMLRHPEFFRVGVSASGNHDFRVDKMGWNELWMDWPTNKQWDLQSNYHQVDRLQGQLLIAHGELDSNVHPSASIRLAEKFFRSGKEVDFLLIPKLGHYLNSDKDFLRYRWRYFLHHLPPAN
jgi:dipeptidyl-peptidase 4